MAETNNLICFPDAGVMADRLSSAIAAVLGRAVAERGEAVFAVSGGSTPAALYKALSQKKLDWSRVTALLVDERWTAPGTDGSNESFIRDTLCRNDAAPVRLAGLYRETEKPEEAVSAVAADLAQLSFPPDATVLGMGPDGHTASWFPHAEGLEHALNSDEKVIAIRAQKSAVTGDHVERLTLTASAICASSFPVLLMTGETKRRAFEEAAGSGPVADMPVRHLLQYTPNLWPCWAP